MAFRFELAQWRANLKRQGVAGFRKCGHLLRQHRERDLFAIGENDGPLDRIFEFAHVSGPVVAGQGEHRLFGKSLDRLTVFVGVHFEEVHRQQLHIIFTFA